MSLSRTDHIPRAGHRGPPGAVLTSGPAPQPRHPRGRQQLQGTNHYSSSEDEGGNSDDSATNPRHGLGTEDSHISPIENLDNTISRLYSYLSGSEGEPEPPHSTDSHPRWHSSSRPSHHHNSHHHHPHHTTSSHHQHPSSTRPSHHPHHHTSSSSKHHPSHPSSSHQSLRGHPQPPPPCPPHPSSSSIRPPRSSSCHSSSPLSSRSTSPERGGADIGDYPDEGLRLGGVGYVDDQGLNHRVLPPGSTLSSAGGENVYSRITDTSTLPLGGAPSIPPPPLDDALGPAVPPRGNLHMLAAQAAAAGGRIPHNDSAPAFLRADGGQGYLQGSSPSGSPAPLPVPFPRTVPRTNTLPHQHRGGGGAGEPRPHSPSSPPELTYTPAGRTTTLPHRGGGGGPGGHPQQLILTNNGPNSVIGGPGGPAGQGVMPHSHSTDRQNVTFQPNSTLLPPLPTYPSVQNDFRDFNTHSGRFSSTSYRVKKHIKTKCTWRIVALVLALLVAFFACFCAVLIVMKVNDLTWRMEAHPNRDDPDSSQPIPGSESTTPPVIIVQYPLGKQLEKSIAPYDTWRTQFYMPTPTFVKLNVTVPPDAVLGIYGRRNMQPSHAQYDFFHKVDANAISMTEGRNKRDMQPASSADSAFVEYMESGLWYVFLYNDGPEAARVSMVGSQQDDEASLADCPNSCHGRGDCLDGTCQCFPGYTSWDCGQSVCPVLCSGSGIYVRGQCQCHAGWKGVECATPEGDCEYPDCHGNGKCVSGTCICSPGWMGEHCDEEVCAEDCVHGVCEERRCLCDRGWGGSRCDVLTCDPRCNVNGVCTNGTCVCKPGWNGRHCSLDGCPSACNNHGACQLFHDGWKCSCADGWKGHECKVAMETECEDGEDGDDDGMVDCEDPDCCMSISCQANVLCDPARDPMEILLRKQPPSSTASFFDRMRFLVEDDSVQTYATLNSFNHSQASVIRGQVLSSDGSPIIGARVSVDTQPLYGFTNTRDRGLFDILVNGGGSVTLQFQRQPFVTRKTTVMVPWNTMVTMDTVTLLLTGEKEQEETHCPQVTHDHFAMKPVVLSTWQHTQLGACPEKSTIIPESQVLQESLQVPDTDMYLVYHSSETSGYMSTILIQLTPATIPDNLALVHLRVSVEGLVFNKLFEADGGLKYKFAWDRRNAYNKKVYGIVTAHVGVGYQYAFCERIFWETQSATMSGYDITSSEIGGWNLHIHHTYNFQEGILHKGDGTNIYLKERPRKYITVLGNGKARRPNCRGCDGKAQNNRLLAPVALASGRDGSLYVGDFNFIRKLSANREDVASILEFGMHDIPYKYFMTVSPLDGKLYISDYQSKQISRVKTMGAVRELTDNVEVIAGTGDQCVPGDAEKCGDGGPAKDAKLFYPKGIAIDKDGIIYFADGANVRVIDKQQVINTMIGSQSAPRQWVPFPCDRVVSIEEVTLHWPTALAVNPLDDSLHILDNNMVLKVTRDRKLLLIAGRPLHCPPATRNVSSLLSDEQAGPKLAHQVLLHSPQHIAFAPNGHLYIVESDGKTMNKVRVVSTDGTISHYVGGRNRCNCQLEECECYDPQEVLATNMLLSSPTAITVTPDDVLHIADMGNLMIHSIVATLPTPNMFGQYHVLYPQTQEKYIFNRYGQHMATVNLITNEYLYNFTYHVISYYGKLTKVADSGGNVLNVRRDYSMHAKEIIPPTGQRCRFVMNNMGNLQQFIRSDNSSTKFSYISNTGLLESRENTRGHRYIYEYDENGRLANVIQPTGELSTLDTDVAPAGDDSHTTVSYLHDGALVVEYPFKMAVTMETTPHPLLSTEHQLQVKRKVILPHGLVHRLEWRYYIRRTGSDSIPARQRQISRVGRRLRVRAREGDVAEGGILPAGSESLGNGYEGKVLLINGENLLTIEYDRDAQEESILDTNMDELLLIQYNAAGQPTNIMPKQPLQGTNITYNDKGQVLSWYRGNIGVNNVYDSNTGYLIESQRPNRAVYRYIYKRGRKASDVILPSGKQYLLHYDEFANLKSAVMPMQTQHRFHSLSTLSIQRILYSPPHSPSSLPSSSSEIHQGPFIMDRDSAGKLLHISYPSGERRVSYTHTETGKTKTVHFDWSQMHYAYYPDSGMVREVNLTDGQGYHCHFSFGSGNALVDQHAVVFNGTEKVGLLNAEHTYAYDKHFRLASLQSRIGSKLLPIVNSTYDINTGRLVKVKKFRFEYPRLHREVIVDSNIEIIREYDTMGRLTDIWYRFNNYVKFTLEVKYDQSNRVHQWRRKVGSSDQKAIEYTYDIDGNLVEVEVNDQATWGYEYDANNNIIQTRHYDAAHELSINQFNQLTQRDAEEYEYDADGFLIQRGKQQFTYNSLGQLERSFERGKYDVKYYYDASGRLTARHDVIGNYLTQFFYANLRHPNQITHIYRHSTKELTQLFYDSRQQLFALEQDNTYFYVALDPVGSPILIFNAVGSVVKQMSYDPLGMKITDTSPDFFFTLGYKCGVVDHLTELIHLNGRVYDPVVGRWTSPDYLYLLENTGRLTEMPQILNLYQFNELGVGNDLREHENTDLSRWLENLGYDMDSLMPEVTFDGAIRPSTTSSSLPSSSIIMSPPQQRLLPVTSAFECAFNRDMQNFAQLSHIPVSKVTPMIESSFSAPSSASQSSNAASFAPIPFIFGDGILLSSNPKDGRVIVSIMDSANEALAILATTLFNSSYVVKSVGISSIHGRDIHYFVKPTLDQAVEDVKELSLRAEDVIQGINVSVHRHHETPEIMKFVDIRLHGNHTVLNLRYGSSISDEAKRILHHEKERAEKAAWRLEKMAVETERETFNEWTEVQKKELKETGIVSNMIAEYIRDVKKYPMLADDPKNIKFVPKPGR